MAKSWPNITIKKDAPADAKEFDGVASKFEAHFSSNPGEGALYWSQDAGDQGPGFRPDRAPLRCALKYFAFSAGL